MDTRILKEDELDVAGTICGIKISERPDQPSDLLTFYVEDDGSWFPKFSMSAFWTQDMINVLEKTKEKLDK